VPSQQPDGQLQKQQNKQTQITMDKEQDKIDKHNKTNKQANNDLLKKSIRTP
jgi:hypothetical protein